MDENHPFSLADAIREARRRLGLALRAQAEQIQKLTLEWTELQQLHARSEQEASRQWDVVTRGAELAAAECQISRDTALENVLGAVRGLMTCTIPEQVFATLTEEAAQWGVRAALFDVRGKAAWGASAHGFGPALSENALRALIIPLNQDNPFRQVCETAGPVDASAETLRKNRNLLDKLKPAPRAPVLLLPIRSAGTVAAILYADSGEKADPLPVHALKILAEFAGAQIDRLIALSGGFAYEEIKEKTREPAESAAPVEEAPLELAAEEPAPAEPVAEKPAPAESHAEGTVGEELAVETPVLAEAMAEAHTEVEVVEPPAPELAPPPPLAEMAGEPAGPVAPGVESEPVPPVVAPRSEAEEKVHKDARRFAKLLVSEIELYNKAKVAEGRKNRDLYMRLKSDIDRSRQTFEKRFGRALSKQVDYFHDELLKTLAVNDSTVLGPDYPGPSA